MIPAYQKHLTKDEVAALTAFYGSEIGQKIIRETPAMMADAMQTMMPLLQKQIEAMTERIKTETAQMIKDSKKVS
jgi:hypothetical protein